MHPPTGRRKVRAGGAIVDHGAPVAILDLAHDGNSGHGVRVEATQRIAPEGHGRHSPAADADHHPVARLRTATDRSLLSISEGVMIDGY